MEIPLFMYCAVDLRRFAARRKDAEADASLHVSSYAHEKPQREREQKRNNRYHSRFRIVLCCPTPSMPMYCETCYENGGMANAMNAKNRQPTPPL